MLLGICADAVKMTTTDTLNPDTVAREKMLSRLREDLIGPRSSDETLSARPSDVYLTGILWPKNIKLAPEEDERLAVAPGEEEGGDDAEDQAKPQAVAMRRPSTAGLSFAVSGKGVPRGSVHIRFGMYSDVDEGGKKRWKRKDMRRSLSRSNFSWYGDIAITSGEVSGSAA